jgi:hypothetical protein
LKRSDAQLNVVKAVAVFAALLFLAAPTSAFAAETEAQASIAEAVDAATDTDAAVFEEGAGTDAMADAADGDAAGNAAADSLGLTIFSDSVRSRTETVNTNLRLTDYELFSADGISKYEFAKARENAKDGALLESLFTEQTPVGREKASGAEQARASGILTSVPEYNQGLYDESALKNYKILITVLIFVGVCALSFFAARIYTRARRRMAEAETCTSTSP